MWVLQKTDRTKAHRARASRTAAGRGIVSPSSSTGDAKTIEFLNLILKNELTAINQYFLHSRMLANWGISELSKKEYDESIDEMKHADSLVQRILFLGGLPNLQYLDKLLIGENTEEVIACDLKFEEKAIGDLRGAIAHAEQVRDYGSRTPPTSVLKSERNDIHFLRTQQRTNAAIRPFYYLPVQTPGNSTHP